MSPVHYLSDRILPLGVDHFSHNGNLKNIAHIDADADAEARETEQSIQKTLTKNSNEIAVVQVKSKPDNFELELATKPKVADDKESAEHNVDAANDDEEKSSLWHYPSEKSCWKQIMWIIIWPTHLLFVLTIPDCDRKRFKNYFPLTFLMCIIWIGSLSYLVAWMITIVGKMVAATAATLQSELGIDWDNFI